MTTNNDTELDLIKQLLFGAYLATLEMVHLGGAEDGKVEKGLDLEAAFEKQWGYIIPHLDKLIATKQLEARLEEVQEWIDNIALHYQHTTRVMSIKRELVERKGELKKEQS